jgi:CSLREA domain-containing protein
VKAVGVLLALLGVILGSAMGLAQETESGASATPDAGEAQILAGSTPVWLWAGGGSLHDVALAGDDGWLCGGHGTLGHTPDGGLTWSGQYAGHTAIPLYAIAASDADHVWAVGGTSSGLILHSWTGGAAWMGQAANADWSFEEGDIAFVGGDRGWAVGTSLAKETGLILHTGDGGAHWSTQSSGGSSPLHGVSFADANNGWAVGDKGTILHTTDGGASWTGQASGVTERLNGVFALDASHAWAVGDNLHGHPQATILRTENGGSSWSAASSVPTAQDLNAVAFASASKGWAVGDGGVILHTVDGGKGWVVQDSSAAGGYTLHGLAPRSTTRAIVVGEQGVLLRTGDGGTTWTAWSPVATLHGVDFPGSGQGWVAGEDKTLAHTTDGGLSWSSQDPGVTAAQFYGLSMVDTLEGFVAGSGKTGSEGLAMRTSNGGTSWSPGTISPAALVFYDVEAWDATHALAGGEQYIYGTSNGSTWSRRLDKPWTVHGLHLASQTRGWVAATNDSGHGTIYYTGDGGSNWEEQYTSALAAGLRDVFLWTGEAGWAVGEGSPSVSSLIVRTTDGEHWAVQSPPTGMNKDLEAVLATSATEGWVVGEAATVLHTTNGGMSWASEAAQSGAWLYGLARDGTGLWAVGVESTILRRALFPAPPVADFKATPREGYAPLEVSFTDQSAESPAARWWDFGDGSTSTAQHPVHVYALAGDYTVKLTALNAGGDDTMIKTDFIKVTALETCGDAYEPNDDFDQAYLLDPPNPGGLFAYICHAADEDFFQFKVHFDDVITLTLDELPENYELQLLDPSNHPLRSSTNGGVEDEKIIYEANDAEGFYRARVWGAGGACSDKSYHLGVSVNTPPPPVAVVNTTDDVDDGACDASHCSLREAIAAVNTGADYWIHFDIPEGDPGFDGSVWVIQPGTPLPAIASVVNLDGTTQTDSRGDTNPLGPEIVLDGGLAGAWADGLVLDGNWGSTVRGLVIANWWSGAGIHLQGGRESRVYGCYLGTDPTGSAAAPNGVGVLLSGGSYQRIGGDGSGEGNLISGNLVDGVHMAGTYASHVEGNKIGTDRIGLFDLGNGDNGIYLHAGAEDNTIGGDDAGEGNLISANGGDGVRIDGSADTPPEGNMVFGNRIGVNAVTVGVLGNDGDGVFVRGDHNTIGHAAAGYGNVIGGNGDNGVHLQDCAHNLVAGNSIGVDPSGRFQVGNGSNGVLVSNSRDNTIGPGNAIAHNGRDGVQVNGAGSVRNTITENSITANGLLGIDNVDGGNEELALPIVSDVAATYVEGTACPLCRVELFSDTFDEAAVYEGYDIASTGGLWRVDGGLSRWNPAATATDAEGNTSELSNCYDRFEPNDGLDQAAAINPGDVIEAFVCQPDDNDFYTFHVETGSILYVDLEVPDFYVLGLFGPDGSSLASAGDAWSTAPRHLEYTATESGDYVVQVRGTLGAFDSAAPYTLRVAVSPVRVSLVSWLDEGWLGGPDVYKVIPDADGPAGETLVEVATELFVDIPEGVDAYLDLIVPDDLFGAPSVWLREWIGSPQTLRSFSDLGDGRYRVHLDLDLRVGSFAHQQVLFKFGIPPGVPPGEVAPRVELRLSADEAAIAVTDAPAIHLVSYVPAIVVTNRQHLYGPDYGGIMAWTLLAEVTQAAQGVPGGPAGSMDAAIYFVDDYSEDVRDWDNETASYASEGAANEVVQIVDDYIEDWAEDTNNDVVHLMIVGDDDVIPFYRRTDPCDGDDSESAHPQGGHPVLQTVIDHDFFFTENYYADTDGSGWEEANIELSVGRIVGDTAADMLSLFQNGLAGPDYGLAPFALLASWDGFDLYYSTRSRDSVFEWVEHWGFTAPNSLVDNGDWRESDFLAWLGAPYSLLITGNHGNPWDTCVPPDRVNVSGDEITAVISATAPLRRPFYGFGDCRTGFTLVDDGLVDQMIRNGASGVLASPGITWGTPEGSDNYTEELFKMFWHNVLYDPSVAMRIGPNLRRAKVSYDPPTYWYCRHYKAVMELTFFGVPWMVLPTVGGSSRLAAAVAGTAVASAPAFSAPEVGPAGGYAITATMDVSSYTITHPLPGFDLVEIEGFRQDGPEGPLLPVKDLGFALPPGSQVTAVSVQLGGETPLGPLEIPTYIPAVAVTPGGRPAGWVETPPEVGLVPTELYTVSIKDAGTHLMAHIHVSPLTYDAATGSTTLYRQITVTVGYTAPAALALTALQVGPAPRAPGEAAEARAEVVNVSDRAAEFTTTLALADMHGMEMALVGGGPHTLGVGSSGVISPTFRVPYREGTYRLQLTLWQDGQAVAQASEVLQVAALEITAFDGPVTAIPGETATFTVSLSNHTTSPLETAVALQITGEGGQILATLAGEPVLVPARGEATVSFAWEAVGAPGTGYQATAWVAPGSYPPRSLSRAFRLGSAIYLPLVWR